LGGETIWGMPYLFLIFIYFGDIIACL
jgi:hypothetical protein